MKTTHLAPAGMNTTETDTRFTVTVSSLDKHGARGRVLAHGEFLWLRRACEFAGEQAVLTARIRELDTVWATIVEHSPAAHRDILAVRSRPEDVVAATLRLLAHPTTPARAAD